MLSNAQRYADSAAGTAIGRGFEGEIEAVLGQHLFGQGQPNACLLSRFLQRNQAD